MNIKTDEWDALRPFQKHQKNPFKYRQEIDLLFSQKFDGKYELNTTDLLPVYFKKQYGNRNIEYYNLKCSIHKSTFTVGSQSLKKSTNFLKKCKGCATEHNKKIALLSFEDLNNKLRNSHSEYIRKYHFILKSPGFSKNKPKSLRLKCFLHKIVFSQDQNLLGKNHGCSRCSSLASSRGYSDDELKKNVNEMLENYETGLSDLYSYQSYTTDKYKHYSIVFLCQGNGHEEPYPFKQNKANIHSKMCPKCFPKGSISRGERVIADILNKKHLSFEKNRTFQNLKFKHKLHIDFYIKSLNLFIEFDGQQHFKRHGFEIDNEEQLKRLKRDLIKNAYSIENNINLLRIPYNKLKTDQHIEDIVTNAISHLLAGGDIQISNDNETLAFYLDYYEKLKGDNNKRSFS